MASLDNNAMASSELKNREEELQKLLVSLGEKEKKASATQEVLTIFEKIIDIKVNVVMLENSKIGDVLQKYKSDFKDNEMGQEAKKVLSKWKQDLRAESGAATGEEAASTKSAKKTSTTAVKKITKVAEEVQENPSKKQKTAMATPTYDMPDEGVENLPPQRKKVYEKFIEALKVEVDADTDETLISFYAEHIEKSLNNNLSCTTESQAYVQKAMTLVYNLKQNPDLRKDILGGIIPPPDFVKMTSKELAPAFLAAERKERQELYLKSKRTDIYDIARQEIQQENNLSEETEFQCRRCKSTRTTHYAMQTRSSDEPMTIFVCCLNCKFRWRC